MAKKLQSLLMAFFAFTIPALSLFAPLIIAPIFLIAAIYPTYVFFRNGKIKTLWSNSALNKTIIIMLAYSLLSSLWAIKPDESVNLWVRMALFFIGTIALFDYSGQVECKDKILKAVTFGTIFSIVIANFEIFTGGYLTHLVKPHAMYPVIELNRGSCVISIMSWIAACYLWTKNYKYSIALIIAALATTARLESLSAFLTLFISTIFTFPVVYYYGKKSLKIFAIIAVIAVFVISAAAKILDAKALIGNVPVIPGAASDYRLRIWDYAAEQAYKKPIFGWGLNASRSYPVAEEDFFDGGRSPLPLHPHNNTIQVWLELGAVGLVMFAAFLALILLRISAIEASPYIVAACAGLFTNYFIIGQLSYGIWQNWWVASGILAAVFIKIFINFPVDNSAKKGLK